MRAAHAAFPGLARAARRRTRALLRKAGDLIEQRVYDIAAALTLEVGKNRMEALGEAQETVDFFHHYADDFEKPRGLREPAARRSARRHGLAQPQRDAAVRRVGGDRAVQLPVRAGRRAGRRGAGHRQHRGVQVARPTRRGPGACSPTACATPDSRRACSIILSGSGSEVGRGAGRASAHRGHHLHRFGRRSARNLTAADGRRRVSAAVHRRDGRQERRASSPTTPTWIAPPPASCARPSAWAGRSARRSRACTWMKPSPMR